ncbi:MAG: PilZ domain-containing protein [Phycisphaerales bacterium]|nr:PilZ domain-containing protein [Phycisphaerales bacterium]
MSTHTATLNLRRDGILDEARARGSRLTISHRSRDGWRLYPGQFLRDAAGGGGLWVRVSAEENRELSGEGVREALTPGQEVGLTFRRGHKKCICHSTIEHSRADGASLCLQLATPTQIQELQRRVFERTLPPCDKPIRVHVRTRELPAASNGRITGQLEDISAGGMRVRATMSAPISLGASYLCILEGGSSRQALELDAVLRHAEAPVNGTASLGLQFIGMEASAAGYEKMLELARFVKYLQRCASRGPRGGRPMPGSHDAP